MSIKNKILPYFFLLIFLLGTFASFFQDKDLFPFSHWPMYSTVYEPESWVRYRTLGRSESGQIRPLKIQKEFGTLLKRSLEIRLTSDQYTIKKNEFIQFQQQLDQIKEPIHSPLLQELLQFHQRKFPIGHPNHITEIHFYADRTNWSYFVRERKKFWNNPLYQFKFPESIWVYKTN